MLWSIHERDAVNIFVVTVIMILKRVLWRYSLYLLLINYLLIPINIPIMLIGRKLFHVHLYASVQTPLMAMRQLGRWTHESDAREWLEHSYPFIHFATFVIRYWRCSEWDSIDATCTNGMQNFIMSSRVCH